MPEQLLELIMQRSISGVTSGNNFMAGGYEEAVERVQDVDDHGNRYWFGPSCQMDAVPGDDEVQDEFGDRIPIEMVRKMAFEMLVLADLAESSS